MENYSGIVPFLWKTFKKPREKPVEPEMVPLSVHETLMEDEEYFLDSTGGNSPKFPKTPVMFGKSPSRFATSPGKSHKRRHSTGLRGLSLPKLLSSHSQKSRFGMIAMNAASPQRGFSSVMSSAILSRHWHKYF